MENSKGYCITCLKNNLPCDCRYCHNCSHFKQEPSKGKPIYDLEGVCKLSQKDNKYMMAADEIHPDSPFLNVSAVFGCNRWERKPDAPK